jgi:dipeptide transport system substrate-binding protein
VAACAVGLACAAGAQAAGTLTFCSDAAPEGFDVAQFETVPTADANAGIYDQLLSFKPGTSEVAPGLAERWDISPDGLQVTLHLRRGVKFHTTPWFTPTRDFNADDVVWSIDRLNDPAHPAHGAAPNGYPYWSAMSMPALLKSVERLDDHTVRLTLTRPEAPLLGDLAMSALGSVFSAEYGAQLVKAGTLGKLNTEPVGTGPFIFRRYQKDAVIRYDANPGYWGGAPKIDHLVFAITPDPSVRVQRVKAGECLVAGVNADAVAEVANAPSLKVVRNEALMTTYIAPNTQHKFLSDPRFREALALAVDRDTFVQSVYAGNGRPAANFLPPRMWSFDATLKRPHDLARARQLVQAAGYDGRTLQLFATSRAGDVKRGIELLQADWARIGVQVAVQVMELGELYKRTGQGDHDLALLSWFSDNGDPDNFFTPNLSCAAVASGNNKARWCNPAFDALLDQARRTPGQSQRSAIYTRAQHLLFDQVANIPVANRMSPTAMSTRVSGVVLTPFGGTDFRSARVN